MHSAVQINVAKGCVSVISDLATFDYIYVDSMGTVPRGVRVGSKIQNRRMHP